MKRKTVTQVVVYEKWHLENCIQNQQYNKKPKQQLGGKEIYGWYSGSK
jgi:hypothetical protein